MLQGDLRDRRRCGIAAAKNGMDVAQPFALKVGDRPDADRVVKSPVKRAP